MKQPGVEMGWYCRRRASKLCSNWIELGSQLCSGSVFPEPSSQINVRLYGGREPDFPMRCKDVCHCVYIQICIYIYVLTYIYIYVYILQEEQSLCFLKALQNIRFGQPRITCSSPFWVAGVGRSIITLFYKHIRF